MFTDLTKELSINSFVYEGDPKTKVSKIYSIEKDGYELNKLETSLHTATHLDFPAHFIKNGKRSHDYNDINYFTGTVLITEYDKIPRETDKNNFDSVFIKTKNKEGQLKNYNSINKTDLDFLTNRKLKFVGTDFYTIEPYRSNEFEFHKTLLKNEILIIENLNLESVNNGLYEYFIVPLKIYDTEASLCRVLIKNKKNI